MKILDLKDSHRYNLQFDVDGQFVKRTDNNLPVAKCKNLFKAKFNFIGDEWTGTKTALFAQGECSKSAVLDDKDECVIPWEFFDTDENMTIGKVSVSCGDLVTTNCATVKITKSGYQESDASVPPSPDVYQQLVELAEDTKEIAQSVREDADAGEFDGEEGYSPKVSLTEELDGVTVTVQNKDGQQSAKVKNGKDGKNYEHSEEFTRLAEQVRQDKESVEQTKTAVDKTAQDFTLTAQQALADVNNAGQTQSERVQQVGQDAIADVNTAKTQAVETVNATKTDAVKAVQTEGTKQTEAVQVKGQEVINSIPSDFTTQMATKLDKQQGTENAGKSLIIGEDGTVIVGEPAVQIEVDKTLAQEGQAADAKATGDKILQYAIKNTASGEGIVKITDSAEEKLLDFGMQGKTEQEENPSIESPKEIINAGADGQIEVKVTGKNLFDISKNPYKCDEEKICIPSKPLGEINITNGITFEEKTVYYLSWESYTITKPNSDWSPIFGVKYTDGTNEDFYMHLNKSGFKTNANKTIGYVYIRNPWSVGTEVNRIQIEKGTKRTEYEPFKLQTLTILLDRSLTKWDRIEKRDGVYGITYKHKVVEDFATLVKDSEPIYGNPGEKYFSVKADGATLNYDYSKVYSEVGVYKKDVQRLYVPKVMASSFIVGVNDTDTIETAKAHMHYKVIYETDAEEFVPLPQETQTALNNLHTYYPTTVMSNSEDCEMEVEYVADTKNYIDNKISANVASIISQYQTNVANLLSLMPLSVQAGMVENDTNNILENVEVTK